jgi:hypothetical protein
MKVFKCKPLSYRKPITVDYKKARETRQKHGIEYMAGHLDSNKQNRHDIMISTDEEGNNRVSYVWADGGLDDKFRKELIVLDDYGCGWYGISFPILEDVDEKTFYFHFQKNQTTWYCPYIEEEVDDYYCKDCSRYKDCEFRKKGDD